VQGQLDNKTTVADGSCINLDRPGIRPSEANRTSDPQLIRGFSIGNKTPAKLAKKGPVDRVSRAF